MTDPGLGGHHSPRHTGLALNPPPPGSEPRWYHWTQQQAPGPVSQRPCGVTQDTCPSPQAPGWVLSSEAMEQGPLCHPICSVPRPGLFPGPQPHPPCCPQPATKKHPG